MLVNNNMRNLKNLILCAFLLGMLAAATSISVEYEIVDLGSLGGDSGRAVAINDSGQVAGWSFTALQQSSHAFLWTEDDGMQDLGTLGRGCRTHGVNDLGHVVGWYNPVDGPHRAFLWTAGDGMQEIGALCADFNTMAYGINNSGQVVGWSAVDMNIRHAFLWTAEDGMQDLGTLGEGRDSVAHGINNFGQVVGWSQTWPGGWPYAFLWTEESGMQNLGCGEHSEAYAINDLGYIVGRSGGGHAFLWTADTGMQDLGTLGGNYSEGRGINDLGQVVGWSYTASGQWHAFLWTADDGMQDLGTLGGGYSQAWGINDLTQIVGYFWTASEPGHDRACMWIPATAPTWPPGSNITASDAGFTEMTLTWTAATHDTGVAQYHVYKDGTLIGTVAGGVKTFQVA
jgi:probable HAF family extracellular repeat protein